MARRERTTALPRPRPRKRGAAFLQHGHSVGFGHFHVGDHQIQGPLADSVHGFFAVRSFDHVKAILFEDLPQHMTHGTLIFSDEDTLHRVSFPAEGEL